jgi:prepilin-type N-terminal cleavage/methylation domain-containing protein
MIILTKIPGRHARRLAFTLVEVMIAVTILAITFASLSMGFCQGFAIIQGARENLRATQILLEKMETIRLYTWDQMTRIGFVPATFQTHFYESGAQQSGVLYNGQTTISDAPPSESYAADHKLVTFTLSWESGKSQHQRQMTTLVSKYGLHNYIYRSK